MTRDDQRPRRRGPLEADTCRDYVVPLLRGSGWNEAQVIEQHYFTDGRIVPSGARHRRLPGLRADYLLRSGSLPIAVVEAKRLYKLPSDGLQQAMRYAEILRLPFAYASNGRGLVEHDFSTGRQRELKDFPRAEELWRRYRAAQGIVDDNVAAALVLPFNRDLRTADGGVKEARYYQALAVNAAVNAILTGQRRLLLTLATGTGKTFVALQTVWKLWESGWRAPRHPRVLYLSDRNILIDQPILREFKPVFGDAVWKVSGAAKAGREIYFALYQNLADGNENPGIFREYPRDFFDLVVVDECHRGSARDDSSWRGVLEHFAPAAQLGMTATPLRDENIDSYRYFGNPLYVYTLAQGIADGFLAPYKVRRVVLSPDALGWQPTPEQLDLFGREIPPDIYTTQDFERVVSLLMRTRTAAAHLTGYLKRTGRMSKTIVFCVDQEHAEQMRLALHQANDDLTRQYPHYVARIVADEGDVGRELLDDFADPEKETPVIVTTSRLLSTGVDVPTCRNIVLFRPIGSIVEFKQIIGRGTRLFPDDDKLSFTIVDYVGATTRFNDPGFDGLPEEVTEEAMGPDGEVAADRVLDRSAELIAAEGEAQGSGEQVVGVEVDELAPDPRAQKFYVDEGTVTITAEAVYVLAADSNRLSVVRYEDYAAEQVRRMYPQAQSLRARWRTHEGRKEIVRALETRGISFEELAERTGLREADPFDLLVHVAWNGPISSRRERAARVKREQAQFFAKYGTEARAVLDELLEKYADYGVDQLDDMHVLEIPPLSAHGTPIEIAARFGGPQALRNAVEELQVLLYAA